jgi:hypothetical protein
MNAKAKAEAELTKSLLNWERCRSEGDGLGMRIWFLCAIGDLEALNRASLSAMSGQGGLTNQRPGGSHSRT